MGVFEVVEHKSAKHFWLRGSMPAREVIITMAWEKVKNARECNGGIGGRR